MCIRHIPEQIDPAINQDQKSGPARTSTMLCRLGFMSIIPSQMRATIDTKYGPNNFVSATAKLNKPRPFSGERACPVCVGKQIGGRKAAMRASVFRISPVTISRCTFIMMMLLSRRAQHRRLRVQVLDQDQDQDDEEAKAHQLMVATRTPLVAVALGCIICASYYHLKTSSLALNKHRNLKRSRNPRHLEQVAAAQWLHDLFNKVEADSKQTRSIPTPETGSTASFWDSYFAPNGADSDEAELEDYPFYVNSLPPYTCGGTLVHPDFVLSAAKCANAFDEGAIIGGVLLDGSDGVYANVSTVFLHPDYNETTGENNIMLVQLGNTSDVPSAVLNFDEDIPIEGEPITLVGYGQLSGSDVKNTLFAVNVASFNNGRPDQCTEDR